MTGMIKYLITGEPPGELEERQNDPFKQPSSPVPPKQKVSPLQSLPAYAFFFFFGAHPEFFGIKRERLKHLSAKKEAAVEGKRQSRYMSDADF